MSAETIYNKLCAAGMTHEGACGMLGNMDGESSMKANNLQNSYEGKLGFVDELYTAAVDNGSYKNFANDKAGYGLCQWTYGPRKKNLLEFANSRGASIGDENMQVDFALYELRTEYYDLWTFLCSTSNMYEATARICREFERPAVNNIAERYDYAQKWDRMLSGKTDEQPTASKPKAESATTSGGAWFPPDQSILVLQAVLVANGYNTDITGYKNAHFLAKLREFVTDIGG